MIHQSTNNSEIYKLLENANQLAIDFSLDKVIAFDYEDDFCIVIYSAASRNFILFTAKNYIQDVNSFPDIINFIQEFSNLEINASLLEESIKLIENQMHSKNNSRHQSSIVCAFENRQG